MNRVARVVTMWASLTSLMLMQAAAQERTVFIAEGRIGNAAVQPGQWAAGDFEYDLCTNTAAPAVQTHYPWTNSVPAGFVVQYDASTGTAQFQIGTGSNLTWTVPGELLTSNGVVNVRLGGRGGNTAGSWLRLHRLQWEPEGQPAMVLTHELLAQGAQAYENALIEGLPAAERWRLIGEAILWWDPAAPPARSQMAFQIAFTEPEQIASVQWEQHVKPLSENPAAQGGGVRMFAERDDPAAQPNVDNQIVTVVAKVVPPRAGVKVYFASYDVDDPTADKGPVDAGDNVDAGSGDDNRGTPRNGSFLNGVSDVQTDANGQARVQLVVTTQPGDNFRVAAALGPQPLQAIGISSNDVNRIYVPANSDPSLPGLAGRVSPLLTVWRSLHFELDSMGPMPLEEGIVQGFVVRVESPQKVLTDVDLTFGGKDKSPNLDNPAQVAAGYRGRFEQGDVLIGTGLTTNLHGNGQRQLRCQAAERFELPFSITKNGVSIASGQVRRMETAIGTTRFHLDVNSGSLSVACIGGILNVCGEEEMVSYVAVATSGVNVERVIKLPMLLRDDDQIFVPSNPDVSTLSAALEKAFVVPKFDTPAVTAHNSQDRPFIRNVLTPVISSAIGSGWGTELLNQPDFWVAYVIRAFEPDTYYAYRTQKGGLEIDADGDSENEPRLLGISTARGIMVFSEAIGDRGTKHESWVMIHEVGHTIGRYYNEDVADDQGEYSANCLTAIRGTKGPRSRFY